MTSYRRLILFLLVAILGISFTFYGFQIVYTPNFLVDAEDRDILIKDDMSFKDIQRIFHEERYVDDLVSFSFLAKVMGYTDNIKPGRYIIRKGMTNIEVVRMLRAGDQVPVNITFNNVRLPGELAEKITKNLSITPPEFEAALVAFTMSNSDGFTKDNVLSMFIPNTYQVYYNVKPDALVERMHGEYNNFWNEERRAKAKAIGFTPLEVSVLASIVQAESVRADEAPVIAGLYINRLKKGIPLQADPTLVFAVGDFSLKRVLNVHKEIDSPYNTYRNAGLPPGPINLPEIRTLDAVLNYTPSDYIYMCAKEDFSGRHNFTSSHQEHINNAIRYQRALTIEQRKGAALKRKL